MKLTRALHVAGVAATISVGSIDIVSAHHVRHGSRHHARRDGGGANIGAAFVVGPALGLLDAGIAGAAAADNGYSYGFPAYGSGYSGYGAYGPGYGYYGY